MLWKVALLMLIAVCCNADDRRPRAFKRSEVVSMYKGTPELFETYGITMLGWGGGRPQNDSEEAIARHKGYLKSMHAIGVRCSSCVGFRTELRAYMQYDPNYMNGICRDIFGQPTKVRDWMDLKKEFPYYWACTNNPKYREFLRSRARLAMLSEADGLHFDDYRGTSAIALGGRCGGFCHSCVVKFREYLKDNVPRARLRELGIDDVGGFRYDEFLASKGIQPEEYKRKRGTAPLYGEFQTFHLKAASGFVKELRDYAWELRGEKVPFACNCNPVTPENLMFAPLMDYFCCEVWHGAQNRRCENGPIFTYKMGDWLNRPVASTASGHDWAFVKEHNLPGLVRTWIAQSYAFGHCLMAPHYQWCFNEEKLSHWYRSKPEDYAHIYRFVRRNASLFDEYETVAHVALLYSNPDFRAGRRGALAASSWLADNNVPFAVVVAGDDWLDVMLGAETAAKYKALVVPMPTVLDGTQKKVIDALAAAGKIVTWDSKSKEMDEAVLFRLVPRQIEVEGAENVMVVPGAIPGRPGHPVIVHLLNRNYDADKDDVVTLSEFTLTLAKSLFGRTRFSQATLYSPPATFDPDSPGASKPVPLKCKSGAGKITVSIPELRLWGIVKLED